MFIFLQVKPHADLTYGQKLLGMHGYLNSLPNMKSTMLAKGPDFKKNVNLEQFDAIDIYPMVCSLFNMNKCHGSPGKIEAAQQITTGM